MADSKVPDFLDTTCKWKELVFELIHVVRLGQLYVKYPAPARLQKIETHSCLVI